MAITQTELQGHWERLWIETPTKRDTRTRVHWIQAGDVFADVRVPYVRPDLRGARCLADLSAAQRADLALAEGFAGHITVADNTCTWHREIDWHGPSETADVGRMFFDEAGDLIEDGVLATYRELWRPRARNGLRGTRYRTEGLMAVLAETELFFVFGIGAELTSAGSGPSAFALGTWRGDQGIARLCTNPFLEGGALLHRGTAGGLTCTLQDEGGAPIVLDLTADA